MPPVYTTDPWLCAMDDEAMAEAQAKAQEWLCGIEDEARAEAQAKALAKAQAKAEARAEMDAHCDAVMARAATSMRSQLLVDERFGQGAGEGAAVRVPTLLVVQVQNQSQRPADSSVFEVHLGGKSPGQTPFSVNKDITRNKELLGLDDGKGLSARGNDPLEAGLEEALEELRAGSGTRRFPWDPQPPPIFTPEELAIKQEAHLFDSLLEQSNDLCWQGQERVLTKCPYQKILHWTWKPTGREGETNVPCEGRWCSNCQPVIAKRYTERAWRAHLRLRQTVRSQQVWRSYRDKLNYKGDSFLRVPQPDEVSIVLTTRHDGVELSPSRYFEAIWEAFRTSPKETRLAFSDDLRPPPREHDPNLSVVIVGQAHPTHPVDRESFFAAAGRSS